jgi:hypothetical protein
MSSIGAVLRAAREARTVSFDEAYSMTKIQPSVLQLLENDSFEKLPNLCVRSFLKAYSGFLQVDAQPLLDAYHEQAAEFPPAPVKAAVKTCGRSVGLPADAPAALLLAPSAGVPRFVWPEQLRQRKILTLKNLGIVTAPLIVLLASSFYTWGKPVQADRGGVGSRLSSVPRSTRAVRPVPAPTAISTAAPAVVSTAVPVAVPTAVPAVVPAKAARSVLLRIACNGKAVYEGLLDGDAAQGAIDSWTADASSYISPKLRNSAPRSLGKGVVTQLSIRLSGSCEKQWAGEAR